MKYDKLGNLCLVKGGKRLPKGKALLDYKTEHPYLRITDYASGNIDLENLKYISNDVFDSISKYTINKKDIFLSIVGTIGIVDIIDEKLDGASLTENAVKIIVKDRTKIDVNYLAYYLKSTMGQYEIDIRTVGSTQKKLAITRIKDIPVPVIEINKQRKIASVLSSLDSKIKLNKQIISNLEELASTLFKRWFVDFEFPDENGNPYKSSGGKMVDSEFGEVPEGWEINPLSSIAKITSGKRPYVKKTNPDKDNIIPIVGASKIMGYTNQVLENGSIITTGRVGTHGIIQRYREKVWVSDNSFIIKSDTEEFLNQILLRIDYKNLNRGSTQPLITQTDLKKYKIVLPSSKFIEMFESVISKLTECEFQIKKQNLNLEKIRDSLLPKLLSGEIELPED